MDMVFCGRYIPLICAVVSLIGAFALVFLASVGVLPPMAATLPGFVFVLSSYFSLLKSGPLLIELLEDPNAKLDPTFRLGLIFATRTVFKIPIPENVVVRYGGKGLLVKNHQLQGEAGELFTTLHTEDGDKLVLRNDCRYTIDECDGTIVLMRYE